MEDAIAVYVPAGPFTRPCSQRYVDALEVPCGTRYPNASDIRGVAGFYGQVEFIYCADDGGLEERRDDVAREIDVRMIHRQAGCRW